MFQHRIRLLFFTLVSFMLYSIGGANEACGWEERTSIALEKLNEPAIVLREYSDVNSARDCYIKCCELKDEGCNVASFMSYESGVICMNVKCEPFDNCIWGTYPTSIAAVISRPSNAVNNSFSTANLGNKAPNTSPETSTEQNDTSSENTTAQSGNDTGSNAPAAEDTANGTSSPPEGAIANPTPQAGTTPGPFVKPESKDPNNPFHPNYDPSQNSNDNAGSSAGGNDNGNPKDNTGLSDNSGQDNAVQDNSIQDNSRGKIDEGAHKNTTLSITEAVHVNYTISIAIGVLTCVAFVVIMYIAARKFRLFQDRSKYGRLLENPEQYGDNFSASDFED